MTILPAQFAADVVRAHAGAGRAWLGTIPTALASGCARWGLDLDGEVLHRGQSLVWPARRGAELLAVKITFPGAALDQEVIALRVWDGDGAVLLVDDDVGNGLVLVERLDPGRTLADPDIEVDRAVVRCGRLLRRLAVPAPDGIERLRDRAATHVETMPRTWVVLGRPLPVRVLEAAVDAARQLGPSAGELLVDRDLRYGNVLAGDREPWLAVDPVPVAGDPEYGIAQLLLHRMADGGGRRGLGRRLAMLVATAALDPGRATAWSLVHVVDYWLWAVEVGLPDDPRLCAEVADWLLEVS